MQEQPTQILYRETPRNCRYLFASAMHISVIRAWGATCGYLAKKRRAGGGGRTFRLRATQGVFLTLSLSFNIPPNIPRS